MKPISENFRIYFARHPRVAEAFAEAQANAKAGEHHDKISHYTRVVYVLHENQTKTKEIEK